VPRRNSPANLLPLRSSKLIVSRPSYLPSQQVRWCTEYLKIKPFEEFIGDSLCHNYIGIRADEVHRKGYISKKPNIIARYPFIEEGIKKEDVIRILEDSGLGLPDYYKWRTRSGCYFCFFQQKSEWIGLLEHHPDLYSKAESYEKEDPITGERYTWSPKESLKELRDPERRKSILEESSHRQARGLENRSNQTLVTIFQQEDGFDDGCLICHL